MAERDLKKYLLKRVKQLGGEARKVSWEGRNNAPDWFVMLPWKNEGVCFFIELKDEGEEPNKMQWRELEKLWHYNSFIAEWANSEEMIDDIFHRHGYEYDV